MSMKRAFVTLGLVVLTALASVMPSRAPAQQRSPTAHIIYAANNFPATASVTEYSFDANGDVAPTATIGGPDTGLLMGVAGLSVDSNGYLYAATSGVNGTPNAIVVYSPGANGDAPPVRTLTALSHGGVWSVATAEDAAGDLWVANLSIPALEEFAPNASGDAQPIRTISGANTGLIKPLGIALSSRGDVWVADLYADEVMRFGPGQKGNVAPKQVIAGPLTGLMRPVGVALGPGTIWVADVSFIPVVGVREFSSSVNGDELPLRVIRLNGPFSINGGPLDIDGDVIFPAVGGGQASAVFAFSDRAESVLGSKPLRVISGQNTQLISTGWIAVH
jgi:hypothetical protein